MELKTISYLQSLRQQLTLTSNVSSRTRRYVLYEKLRTKIATDIKAVMDEKKITVEALAKLMGLLVKEMRDFIWVKDLKLSELSQLLDRLDSEAYFIIRPRVPEDLRRRKGKSERKKK